MNLKSLRFLVFAENPPQPSRREKSTQEPSFSRIIVPKDEIWPLPRKSLGHKVQQIFFFLKKAERKQAKVVA